MTSVCCLPPVAHHISMMMAHIKANSSVVFRPLKWPCTRTLASMRLTLKSLPEYWLDVRRGVNRMGVGGAYGAVGGIGIACLHGIDDA